MSVSTQVAVGLALRTLRKTAGLTLDDVAKAAGSSAPYISNVENGNVKPSADWTRNVIAAIGALLAEAEDAA